MDVFHTCKHQTVWWNQILEYCRWANLQPNDYITQAQILLQILFCVFLVVFFDADVVCVACKASRVFFKCPAGHTLCCHIVWWHNLRLHRRTFLVYLHSIWQEVKRRKRMPVVINSLFYSKLQNCRYTLGDFQKTYFRSHLFSQKLTND